MKELPQRKTIRLKGYDYSNAGYYFITICVQNRRELLCKITNETVFAGAASVGDAPPCVPSPSRVPCTPLPKSYTPSPETAITTSETVSPPLTTGRTGVRPLRNTTPIMKLSEIGEIVKKYIDNTPLVYDNVGIDNYVIMPNHIHMILVVKNENVVTNDETHRRGRTPCVPPMSCVPPVSCVPSFGTDVPHPIPNDTDRTKSIVAKTIKALKSLTTREIGFSIWQRSYHDHIIRNEPEYQRIYKYIDENPQKWANDCFYS